MTVLSNKSIWKHIKKPFDKDPLIITPLLDPENQIGNSSIDLRLGHEFIVLRKSSISGIDPTELDELQKNLYRTQERIRISLKKEFVIHPGQLILGSTLEYISIPKNIFASIEGRSSWGRLGLIIATATSIAPGFKGCVTLELVNSGEVPITLYPGFIIAQLILYSADSTTGYSGKYSYPTGPEFTRLNKDPDISIWGKNKIL